MTIEHATPARDRILTSSDALYIEGLWRSYDTLETDEERHVMRRLIELHLITVAYRRGWDDVKDARRKAIGPDTTKVVRRPLGVPSDWTVEGRGDIGPGGARQWELMEGTAHRGLYDTPELAAKEARELSGDPNITVHNLTWHVTHTPATAVGSFAVRPRASRRVL